MVNDQRHLTVPGAPFFASLPPVYAGYFRGMAAAVALAALEAAAHYLAVGPSLPPSWAVVVPVAVILIRTAEGAVDHWSTQGGGPPELTPIAPVVPPIAPVDSAPNTPAPTDPPAAA